MSFTINRNIVFIDSMQFMKSSRDLLVTNLVGKDFKHLSKEYSSELLRLVKEKDVYPYEYMDSFKGFDEDRLPDKFFSSLRDKCISKDEYDRDINIWNVLKMNSIGDYHSLYLKTDVLLLTDVYEKFIKMCLDYCGLDPCHYFSSLGLS